MSAVGTILPSILDDLRGCLCAALHGDGDPTTCFCGLYPGPLAVADWCSCKGRGEGCGMAWVRLDRIYPSTQFPIIDTTAGSCASPLAAVLEVGVYRCVPRAQPPTNQPDPVALANAVLRQVSDAAAMHKALTCCPSLAKGKRPTMLGTYLPVPSGDCGGGVWQITAQLVG